MTRLNEVIEEVRAEVTRVASSGNVLQKLDFLRHNPSNLSHTIFQLSPTSDSRELATCRYDAVSRWVVDCLLKPYESREADEAAKLYRNLSAVPWAAAFRGCLFERQVMAFFDRMEAGSKLSIRGLANSNQMTWTYREHTAFVPFHQDETATNAINSAIQAREPLHLVPSTPNFASVNNRLQPERSPHLYSNHDQ